MGQPYAISVVVKGVWPIPLALFFFIKKNLGRFLENVFLRDFGNIFRSGACCEHVLSCLEAFLKHISTNRSIFAYIWFHFFWHLGASSNELYWRNPFNGGWHGWCPPSAALLLESRLTSLQRGFLITTNLCQPSARKAQDTMVVTKGEMTRLQIRLEGAAAPCCGVGTD